jgi:glucosylceramidase
MNTYKKTGEGVGGWLSATKPTKIFLAAGLILPLISPAVSAQSQARRPNAPAEGAQIQVYESSEELHETLQEKPPLPLGATRLPNLTITVNDAIKFQRIDGFGASLTDSSAWLFWNKLSESQRRETLQMLFSRDKGIGLSVLRQPMGASDFALAPYSYDDMPLGQDDPQLNHFSVDHDRAYIIPILREALAINPNLKIMATPWSPSGWMKTSGSMIRGALLPSAYSPLAKYFVRFVQEYENAGLPIYAVTPQNEPLNVPGDYPGMDMSAREQAEFVARHLGPAFRDARLKTKILVFDHNWDLIDFPFQVLSDPAAASFAAGTATHCYGGVPSVQNELHERFPNKEIWMTECSGGDWQTGKLLQQQVRLVIDSMRNWAQTVVLWNLALNQMHQPFLGGCTTCRGIVTVNDSSQPAQVTPTVDYTALAHASKFVAPGAVRVDSNEFGQGSLEDVAFLNPDGSLVLLVMNSSGGNLTFNIGWAGKFASYKLPSAGVATFRWNLPAAAH